MKNQKRLVIREYNRLLRLYQIPKKDIPVLSFKNELRALGRYYSKKRFGKAKIKIDIEESGDHAVKVLRHEFAHFLQELRGTPFYEAKAKQFERNRLSNVPYPPLRRGQKKSYQQSLENYS